MTLKQLVEAGERQLAACEDPQKREYLRAKLMNDLCARFPDAAGLIELDGELLKPVSDIEVEDKITDDYYDRCDSATASDMAEEGCYDDDEGEGEPRIR